MSASCASAQSLAHVFAKDTAEFEERQNGAILNLSERSLRLIMDVRSKERGWSRN